MAVSFDQSAGDQSAGDQSTGDQSTGDQHTGSAFGETGSAAAEYFHWHPDGAPFAIHMHRDSIDGITRDAVEGLKSLPRRGLEIGGLLLGRVAGNEVWIERFKRIDSNHRFGPQYALDDEDRIVLESTANSIIEAGELSVVGLYRSQTRPGFEMDEADRELIRRYFADTHDLVLLIRPENFLDLEARFFIRQLGGDEANTTLIRPVGEAFPFRGHGISLGLDALPSMDSDPEATRQMAPGPDTSETPDTPDTRVTHPAPGVAAIPAEMPAQAPLQRRIVPDFIPDAVEPGHARPASDTEPLESGFRSRRWWPMLAAAAVVAAGAAFLLLPARHSPAPAPAPAQVNEPVRPLGLFVSAAGNVWRVSWNPNATALRDARGVQLFVREGDDQNRIELTPRDLSSGTYEYHPTASDVTFRLEATQSSGAITAESFRYDRSQPPVAAAAGEAAGSRMSRKTAPAAARQIPPRAIKRVPPVVANSIRPRIPGTIPIDVRVKVDRTGHVTSAVPVTRLRDGLHRYLAQRAIVAARQWRFEPEQVNGQPAMGEETIHFVFQK